MLRRVLIEAVCSAGGVPTVNSVVTACERQGHDAYRGSMDMLMSISRMEYMMLASVLRIFLLRGVPTNMKYVHEI